MSFLRFLISDKCYPTVYAEAEDYNIQHRMTPTE